MRTLTSSENGQLPLPTGEIGERQLLRSLYIAALLSIALPPLIGGTLMGVAGFYPMPELYLIFTSYSAPYVLAVMLLVLSQVGRFYRFIVKLPQLQPRIAEQQVRQLAKRLPIFFFLLVTLYTNIGILSADISLESMGYQINSVQDRLYHQVGIIPVVLITTFPIFFYLFDQLGRYLAPRGIQVSAIPLWIKIVMLGTVTPLLIDTLLVGYYVNTTGQIHTETLYLWFSLIVIALAGTWIAWRSLKLSITPLERFLTNQDGSLRVPSDLRLIPLSLDEMGVLTGKLSGLTQELGSVTSLQKAILDNMAQTVVAVDRHGVIALVNQAGEKALGYKSAELVGKHTPEIFHVAEEIEHESVELESRLSRHITPGLETLTILAQLGLPDDREWTLVRKDGSSFRARMSISAMRYADGLICGYLGIAVDITEQKSNQVRLERALSLNKEVINTSPIGIAIYDSNGQCVVANQAIAENVGATVDQILAQNYNRIPAWRENGLIEYALKAIACNKRERHEFEITTSFGKRAYFDGSFTPILIGEEHHLLLMLDDITRRKETEKALISSEALLERAQQISRTGHWVINTITMELTGSKFFYELCEIAPGQSFGDMFSMIHVDDQPEVRARLDKAIHEGNDLEMEIRIITASKRLLWLHLIAKTSIGDDGKVSEIAGTVHDITKLKAYENDLRISQERLNEAQRLAKVGSWVLDIKNNHLEWSDEIFRLFEIDKHKFGSSYEAFLETIHPDDREMVNVAYTHSLESKTPYEIDHRLMMKDGRIKHVHETCETIYDKAGAPLVSRGTVQDVSEQRQAARTIELYANVFRHSAEAIMITDNQNNIVAINPAFTELTGYALDELLGKNPRVLSSGHTPKETYEEMWQGIINNDHWQGELTDRRKDGSIYPKWASISVSRDQSGKVANYIASFSDITSRKAAEERIFHLAHHDPLTGLHNRYSLEERLAQSILQAQRDSGKLAVLFIDMDRFKLINDTLGHHIGDSLLIEVAARLRGCVRECDIVARLGGDEFVVVLTGILDAVDAAIIGRKIVSILGAPYKIGAHDLHSTPSVGISIMPEDGESAEELMKNADTAMYYAKAQGRNNYQYFRPELTSKASEALALERELRTAIAEGELQLYYQPKVVAANGAMAGTEALLRWNHPVRGMVMPDKFIPIAEESDLIDSLGGWVLEEACRQLQEWRDAGINTSVAVNLSFKQLRNKHLSSQIRDIMKKYAVSNGELELEVTESVAMTTAEFAIEQMHELRMAGAELTIDDFGTGYSSLSYLKLFPVQTLKLDRSFVRDIETDENDSAICKATIALAHSLGMKVVAEGVETEIQRQFLVEHGCDILQGYLFGKPQPASQVIGIIRERTPATTCAPK